MIRAIPGLALDRASLTLPPPSALTANDALIPNHARMTPRKAHAEPITIPYVIWRRRAMSDLSIPVRGPTATMNINTTVAIINAVMTIIVPKKAHVSAFLAVRRLSSATCAVAILAWTNPAAAHLSCLGPQGRARNPSAVQNATDRDAPPNRG